MNTFNNGCAKRNPIIDIIKGMGIILMVVGHSGFPFTRFIYLFHMAIFFVASGFCFKTNDSDSLSNYLIFLKKKFLSLWFPYIIWTSIFSLLHNVFISLNIYTDNILILNYTTSHRLATHWTWQNIITNILKSFLLSGGTQMGGALWFVCVLIKISLLYVIIDYCIKKIFKDTVIVQAIVSLVLLFLGFFMYLKGISILSLDKVFSYYCLFFIGFALKKSNFSEFIQKAWARLLEFLVSLIILLLCYQLGHIELADTYYKNPAFLIITSLAGWQLLYELAFFISKLQRMSDYFIIIGKNTLAVVILHFLSFKIVSYIGIKITDAPDFLLASFPIYMKNGLWWVAYTVTGVFIPVLLSIEYKNLKGIIKRKCLHSEQKSIA